MTEVLRSRSIVNQHGDHLVVDVGSIVPLCAGVDVFNSLAVGSLDSQLNSLVADITEKQNADGSGTGIGKESEDTITVYTSGNTVIVNGLSGKSSIEVYTYNGVKIRQIAVNTADTSFSLPSGNYIVRVATAHTTSVKKILTD